ncbi:MAG: PEP-CTERM-box response regulator transcription factor [Proteobacteria bacterium]|nr:PEP-CTERM-box response regulator transcription factor [Pseudomonadota bacterium]
MGQKKSDKQTLLIIEDDTGLQKQLKWSFDTYDVFVAGEREEAVALLREEQPPVVTLDLGLPPDTANASEGLAALEQILATEPDTKVIVVTGNDEHENALKSINLGAYDFYQKPIEPEILGLIIERAFKLYALEQENKKLLDKQSKTPVQGIIASSPQMLNVCETITNIAPADVSVLLLGESGTGKELLARAVHYMGTRNEGAFITINCAAIPENLLESELFGYEKGAFTGAAKQTRGKIEYADGGTLFLDEIGDLPLALQAKLLRFLQERVIERVGGRKEIPVDLRIVCATHEDLVGKIKSGEFREDLYYRISEITINIPPLRDRADDAVLLANHFLNLYRGPSQGRKAQRFSKTALSAIQGYSWPGNARELENAIKRAVVLAESVQIEINDLGLTDSIAIDDGYLDLKSARKRAEKEAIEKVLISCNGKIMQAAKILGVTRPTLYSLVERYGLKNKA